MTLQEFACQYRSSENLGEIPREDFPAELKQTYRAFVHRRFEETDMDAQRALSGFDDMPVESVLRYAGKERTLTSIRDQTHSCL